MKVRQGTPKNPSPWKEALPSPEWHGSDHQETELQNDATDYPPSTNAYKSPLQTCFFNFWANTGILIADDFQIYLERLNFPHTLCIPQQPYSQFFFFPFFSISSVIRSPSSAVRSGPILGIAPLLASICVVTCSQEPATMRHFWNYLSCSPSSIKLKINATAPPFLAFYAHT